MPRAKKPWSTATAFARASISSDIHFAGFCDSHTALLKFFLASQSLPELRLWLRSSGQGAILVSMHRAIIFIVSILVFAASPPLAQTNASSTKTDEILAAP